MGRKSGFNKKGLSGEELLQDTLQRLSPGMRGLIDFGLKDKTLRHRAIRSLVKTGEFHLKSPRIMKIRRDGDKIQLEVGEYA